jgi:hypothetical protein
MTELPRRQIKLKEWGRLVDIVRTPQPNQIEYADTTLKVADYTFRTDENGFIANGSASLSNATTVIVLGDSVAECSFMQEQERLCAVTERVMRERGHKVNVLNAATSGATTLSLYNLLINKGLPLKPAIVVLMSGVSDCDALETTDSFWTTRKHISALDDPAAPDTFDVSTEINLQDRAKLLRLFAASAEAFGFRLVLATSAHRLLNDDYMHRTHPKEWYDLTAGRRFKVNDQTRQFAVENLVPLMDFEALHPDLGSLLYDPFHMTPPAAEMMGVEMADLLGSLLAPSTQTFPAPALSEHQPADVFLIQCSARSGSTWMRDALSSHPDIATESEVLHPDINMGLFWNYVSDRLKGDPRLIGMGYHRQLLIDYINKKRRVPEKLYGFDVKVEQLFYHPALESALHWSSFKIIILERYNLLRQVVSEYLMYHRGSRGVSPHGTQAKPKESITIDPAQLVHKMRIKKRLVDDYKAKALS